MCQSRIIHALNIFLFHIYKCNTSFSSNPLIVTIFYHLTALTTHFFKFDFRNTPYLVNPKADLFIHIWLNSMYRTTMHISHFKIIWAANWQEFIFSMVFKTLPTNHFKFKLNHQYSFFFKNYKGLCGINTLKHKVIKTLRFHSTT